MTERIYIDIGAKRIQAWISKPLKLKYIKGGSLRLSVATDDEVISSWLYKNRMSDFAIVPEAGNIDGVVVLVAKDVVSPERADEVAKKLLLHLNNKLPGVEWSGWRCLASSFMDAFNRAEMDNEDEKYEFEPSLMEFSGVALCEGCKAEARTREIGHVQEKLGVDCASRFVSSEKDDADREEKEKRKLAEYSEEKFTELWPQDFEQLSRSRGRFSEMQGSDRLAKRPRNHIATICADGNKIGALFRELSMYPELADFKHKAIRLLDDFSHQAVEHATNYVRYKDQHVVSLCHYIGGDDILASVVADEAWRFAAVMIEKFEGLKEEYHKILDSVDDGNFSSGARRRIVDHIGEISLGVGIVFSHFSYPFYECRHKAEAALSYAKQVSKGEVSAICWMDMTEGGGESLYTADKYVIDFYDVKKQLDDDDSLPDVFKLTSTAQHNLRDLCIAWSQEDNGVEEDIVEARFTERKTYVDEWVGRFEYKDIDIDVTTMEADLHRARWWPYVGNKKGKMRKYSDVQNTGF